MINKLPFYMTQDAAGKCHASQGVTISRTENIEITEEDLTPTGKIKKATLDRIKSELMQDLVS